MKKVLLTKTLPLSIPLRLSPQLQKSSTVDYKELFGALLRIPDKIVQQRILNAINGVESICSKCSNDRSVTNVGTQTDESTALRTITASQTNANSSNEVNSVQNRIEPAVDISCTLLAEKNQPNQNEQNEESSNVQQNEKEPHEGTLEDDTEELLEPISKQKRRRKRKILLPRVIKKSNVHQTQCKLQNEAKKPKLDISVNNVSKDKTCNTPVIAEEELILKDLFNSPDFITDCVFDLLLTPSPSTATESVSTSSLSADNNHISLRMAKELLECETIQNGLLPIHKAIITNNVDALQRQIFIWQHMKKIDLNTLLTDEDEDCLQLAIVNNVNTKCIEALVNTGLNTNVLDTATNTLLHLAVVNEIDLKSFEYLIKHIKMSTILQLNDDGCTVLHLAVRHNYYLHAEVLLNTLDERLNGSCTYKRNSREKFTKYYYSACTTPLNKTYKNNRLASKHTVKRQLLDMGEMKSGNTALHYAVENNIDEFAFLLLAHFADPRVQNHSAQNAMDYFSEFGKMFNLNIKIDCVMETVVNELKTII